MMLLRDVLRDDALFCAIVDGKIDDDDNFYDDDMMMMMRLTMLVDMPFCC